MATAVIRTGGRQFRVTEGETLRVEKLGGSPGDKIRFEEVLFLASGAEGSAPKFGRPTVAGAVVEAEIVAQERGPKLIVFKFQKRKKSKVKAGHRQDYTAVKITSISA
ncbi:MAG TPA: 50S ribosomal protein L21 [Polyangiaceae bacterium]|nr:50S ribosomal protein L21 [Polyangiaceae bacterium]